MYLISAQVPGLGTVYCWFMLPALEISLRNVSVKCTMKMRKSETTILEFMLRDVTVYCS